MAEVSAPHALGRCLLLGSWAIYAVVRGEGTGGGTRLVALGLGYVLTSKCSVMRDSHSKGDSTIIVCYYELYESLFPVVEDRGASSKNITPELGLSSTL